MRGNYKMPSPSPLGSFGVIILLMVLTCSGCVSTKIDDLKLSSVGSADLQTQTELPTTFGLPSALLLKVSFSTTTDLTQIDDAVTLGDEAFFCDKPDIHARLASPNIFWNGIKIPTWPDTPKIRPNTSHDPITYYTFLRVTLDEPDTGKPLFSSFDLARDPQNICLRLVGGAYRAFGWRSNTIVIPKDTISSVLHYVGRDP
jgi:hypothetical protein